ncbi:unnamed protein product, partial [Sphacelaria rigidula]
SCQAFNCRRQSPLHLACRAGNTEAVMTLLEHGADATARDYNSMQASDMIGAKRPVAPQVRRALRDTLERYMHGGAYGAGRVPIRSSSMMHESWRDRDAANPSPHFHDGAVGSEPLVSDGAAIADSGP